MMTRQNHGKVIEEIVDQMLDQKLPGKAQLHSWKFSFWDPGGRPALDLAAD